MAFSSNNSSIVQCILTYCITVLWLLFQVQFQHLITSPLSLSLSPGMVDVVFADVAQPDQARIVALNAHNFLRNQGHFVISIKVRPPCHNEL